MKQPKLAVRDKTLARQIGLVEEINILGSHFSMENYRKQEALFKDLQDGAKKAFAEGFTLRGSLIRFQVADGYAHYLIVKDTVKWVHVMHISIGDAWNYSGVIDGKLDARVAFKQVQWERGLAELFARK